ncbi:MAG: hypothetical protein LBB10_02675 [Bifidobacteriaceae bacterium]|jgi:predicted porin|nr:hypothetical protein [Bifidobacteriaceae bacterium]
MIERGLEDRQFLYKLGAVIIIAMVCVSTIAVGNFKKSFADGEGVSILSPDKGGTGINYLLANSVLTTNDNGLITFRGVDTAPVKDSLNFITSGAVYSANARSNLSWATVLTLTTDFTGGHADQGARSWGPFIVFEGPIKSVIALTAGTNYLVGTFNVGYRPYQYIGATCSNNHVGSPGGVGRIDCGVNGSNQLRVQTDASIPANSWIDINLVFLKAG